jgi:hypothetical protein
MNDLSVLMPLPRTQAELDTMLGPSSQGNGGMFLPETLYVQDLNALEMPYQQLKLVAFRLDPCFGPTDPVADASHCQNQLRLVFQPLIENDGAGVPATAADGAVHVFYQLSREQLLAAVDDLVAARRAAGGDDDLGPLAPHPLLVREGLAGSYGNSLASILPKYAGPGNLIRFTSFTISTITHGLAPGPASVDQFWLLRGQLVDGTTLSPISIATFPAGTVNMTLDAQSTAPLASRAAPAPTGPDDISALMSMNGATAATAAMRQAAFDAALRIENPRFHTPDTIDCASCHMAQPARELVGEIFGLSASGNANAFVAAGTFPATDLMATTHLVSADGGLNVHAFSYRSHDPMINQRVINETAANVGLVRQLRR